MRLPPVFLALALVLPLAAKDGARLYATYCSACHGEDGTGATGGAFPPLTGSEWVKGNPGRAAKIILHGLEGPVTVSGKTYNLAMPPQGAVLSDEEIAEILTHIRSSWGNQEPEVLPADIAAIREEYADRSAFWTSGELLKLHPLPLEKTALKDLISRLYFGEWNDLPDFTTLEPENVEEEHTGVLSLKISPKTNHFGIVWEGKFDAPENGEYEFRLDADDGARVVIQGDTVVEVRGTGPMGGNRARRGKIPLTRGEHPIRIEFFEAAGFEGISLAWRLDGGNRWHELTDQQSNDSGRPIIPIAPVSGRPVIYRNFIEGTTPRAIGVGFPGGVNLAWSADHLAPELLWTGAFMDAGRHWTDRGQGNQPPTGENAIKLSGSPALPEGGRFLGYTLDANGNPTFTVAWGDTSLTDFFSASPPLALVRKLTYDGTAEPMIILIAGNSTPEDPGSGRFALSDRMSLQVEDASLESRDGSVFLILHPGHTATLIYRWN